MIDPTSSESSSKREPIGEALPVEIIGHRGASFDAPENTLASVCLAWKHGANAVEIDVHLSKDGRILVSHDPTTLRLGKVNLAIAENDAETLRQVDVGSWKSLEFQDERLPFLEEVLATIPLGKRLLIEVKSGPASVAALKKALQASGRLDREAAILSFDPDVVALSKQLMPKRKAYWVVELRPERLAGLDPPNVAELLAKAHEIQADGLDLSACAAITPDFGLTVRQSGLELIVWTVNTEEVARRMIAAGVQGLTTDRPGWLRERLENEG